MIDHTVRVATHRFAGATAMVLLLTMSACGGNDSVDSSSSDPTVSSALSTPATTSDTTTSIPLTETTTASPATSVPAATDPTTTTEVPVVDPSDLSAEELTAQLTTAMDAYTESWVACVRELPACDLTGLAATAASPQLETRVAIIEGGNTNGWSTSNLESYRSQLEAVEFTNNHHTALVTACTEDGIVVNDRTGALVTDRFSSTRTIWTFEYLDGTWKVTTGIQQDSAVGQENTLCSF